jgi:hypothetical protein
VWETTHLHAVQFGHELVVRRDCILSQLWRRRHGLAQAKGLAVLHRAKCGILAHLFQLWLELAT